MVRIVWMALALLTFVSCGKKNGEGSVNTLPQGDRVYSEMWSLATMGEELNRVMKQPIVDQQAAVAILQRMEKTIASLRTKEERKKHPVLADNIDSFFEEVSAARIAAEGSTPNYFFAGKVSGACVYCHDPEGGIRK